MSPPAPLLRVVGTDTDVAFTHPPPGCLAGARLFYLAQTDPPALLTPWSGGFEGFAFYGSIILGLPAAVALRLGGHPVLRNLDLIAAAFPLGWHRPGRRSAQR